MTQIALERTALRGAHTTQEFLYRADASKFSQLQELFEWQVDLRPEALAIESSAERLTYAELDLRANQLAHFLRDQGAGPGQLVGLYYERSIEAIVSILACLKAGAGYVPIDPIFPTDRISHILQEGKCALVLSQRDLSKKLRKLFSGDVFATDLMAKELGAFSDARLVPSEIGASASDISYVIYTSGTTGRPKGVVAEHQHVIRYALAFNEACTTTSADRIFQGFSLGFDGSIEEIWMAFSNGAALICPTPETARFGNDLAHYLRELEVTYFSTVPTLLSTITEEIPSLRQIVVSGEACPPELVDRWDREGRQIWNVYGPTEATVNTTSKLCRSGEPITIGKPLTGYKIYIFNEALEPVPNGEKGELYVGGETLARGYLNQESLTHERFILHPTLQERLYRTGDVVRWNEGGELEFYGRMDGQVKIRGYRIELSEIEQVLLEFSGIKSATVRVYEEEGLKELAAYVLADTPDTKIDRNEVLALLKQRLPSYMVPAYLELLDEFPMLASGKVNRHLLPDPVCPLVKEREAFVSPESTREKEVASVWGHILGMDSVSVEDDFFVDLGGYSLLAAQVVTRLRKECKEDVSIREFYRYPTIRKLSTHLDSKVKAPVTPTPSPTPTSASVYTSVPKWERISVKVLQAASIFGFFLVGTIPFSILVYVFNSVAFGDMSLLMGIGWLFATGAVSWPVALLTAVLGKKLLIGQYRTGSFPLWGFYYFRWWLAETLQSVSGVELLSGTPMLPLYYRMMGAKVGKGCVLDTTLASAWDLIEIGDETTIGADTQIQAYRIYGGQIHFGSVKIGSRCFIGGHSALGLGVVMEDDSALEDQSYLPDGVTMGGGEHRKGSPAVPSEVDIPQTYAPISSWNRPILWSSVFLGVLAANWLVSLALGAGILALFLGAYWWAGLAGVAVWLIAGVPVGIVTYCSMLVGVRYLVMPKARTGVFRIQSMDYVRRWYMDGLMKLNREILKPIYTTLFLPAWLRLMGAKIGERAEISTLWYGAPELLEIESESFFADGCIIGGRRSFRGWVQVEKNKIGRRSFIGNGASLPTGKTVGDDCLLGVLSSPPSGESPVPDKTEWLGNPCFMLPNRKKVEGFDASETFKPTKKLWIQRTIIDGLRILFPAYLAAVAFGIELGLLVTLYWSVGLWGMVALSPFVTMGIALLSVCAVVALKWGVMGKFQPTVKPLWCPYIWLNELVNGAYETIFSPLMGLLLGTPFVAPFLRAMGVKVGKNTYIASILFSEFDLVEIGDYAMLDVGSVLQTHLFEDRIFKSSYLKVGEGSSVGNMAIVLYDTETGSDSTLGPLSLLMKGESLAPQTNWHGIPTTEVSQ